MMSEVLSVTRHIFDTDRAFLLYPCDPTRPFWMVPMERTHPDFPGIGETGMRIPITPEEAEIMQRILAAERPFVMGQAPANPVPVDLRERFRVQSMMGTAVRPRVAAPYMFGLHHCRGERTWTPAEQRLFEEIGHRLADALTSHVMMRRLLVREAQLADAQRFAKVGHWDHDYTTGEVTVSTEALSLLGLPVDFRPQSIAEWRDRWQSVVHPDDRDAMTAAIMSALRTGVMAEAEYRVLRPEGEIRYVEGRGQVTLDAQGQPLRVFGILQDVTERRLAVEAAEANASRFRAFVDHAADAFYLHDGEGRITDINAGVTQMLGYERADLVGRWADYFDTDYTLDEIRTLVARLRSADPVIVNSHHRHKNGTIVPVEVRFRPVMIDGVMCAVSVARDMTPRDNAERALRNSHALLQAVIEGTSDAIFVKDLNGRFLLINSAGARMLGHTASEVVGRRDAELLTSESVRAIEELDRRVMQSEQPWTSTEQVMVNGAIRLFMTTKDVCRDGNGVVMGIVGISRDVTDTRELEDQLRQSQKMEAIGRLAGGIAHDFNNLLTVINGYSAMVLEQFPEGDPDRRLLTNILRCGERAASLTRQLLAFGRKQVLQPEVIQLCTVLHDLREMLHRLIGEDIDLDIMECGTACSAKVDRAQFEQAIVNLAINARDAMPHGGRLSIASCEVSLSPSRVYRTPDVKPGRYVQISVTDTGDGMDEETRTRIFEPFFTTKSPGKGTGLGLAMVYGFVKQSGGHVEVQSRPGQGSVFRIYLPSVVDAITTTAAPLQTGEVPRGQETLLLVEDEAPVRMLLKLALESYGYHILEARTGEQALQLAREHDGPIALLITDLVMPRMSGAQLIGELEQTRPGLKTITMSGYPGDSLPPIGPAVAFLQKPFQPSLLARKVRAMLDSVG